MKTFFTIIYVFLDKIISRVRFRSGDCFMVFWSDGFVLYRITRFPLFAKCSYDIVEIRRNDEETNARYCYNCHRPQAFSQMMRISLSVFQYVEENLKNTREDIISILNKKRKPANLSKAKAHSAFVFDEHEILYLKAQGAKSDDETFKGLQEWKMCSLNIEEGLVVTSGNRFFYSECDDRDFIISERVYKNISHMTKMCVKSLYKYLDSIPRTRYDAKSHKFYRYPSTPWMCL